MNMRPDDPQRASINQILAAADRAAHLTQGLLAFSRKQAINPRPVDLNGIVKNVEKLLRRLIGEDVELTARLSESNLIAMADAGQIEQVLMNLAANARDAMDAGGALIITTEETVLGEDFISANGFCKPGRYGLISFSDTGIGMTEQARDKIFEPFYTTKELGKGTGLGLAIVFGIVKQHDGTITVYSEPGRGTTFKIYLPLIDAVVEKAQAKIFGPPRGGTETILFAEDEENVRSLMKHALEDFGYQVIDCMDGQDALDKFALHGKDIDLMVLDVIMPKKSGKEVYDLVRSARPDIDVLFISGYTADILGKKGIFEDGIELISKPLTPYMLLRKIREMLDKKSHSE
jgi:CheY-like chemotaxis protein